MESKIMYKFGKHKCIYIMLLWSVEVLFLYHAYKLQIIKSQMRLSQILIPDDLVVENNQRFVAVKIKGGGK